MASVSRAPKSPFHDKFLMQAFEKEKEKKRNVEIKDKKVFNLLEMWELGCISKQNQFL